MGKEMTKTTWSKRTVEWVENGTAYLSVPFTWNLPEVYSRCIWYRQMGCQVKAGGPAVSLMPQYLSNFAECNGQLPALWRHNSDATFTSRGCIRTCEFCAVPKIEGDLIELADWEPKPLVCDNNLLACSQRHFNAVIDRLKTVRYIDFNQGLDARLLTEHHLDRIRELDLNCVRFSWDFIKDEADVIRAIRMAKQAGIPKSKIRVYVLVNYKDDFDDAQYRCLTLKAEGVKPYPQRYNPLDTLVRDSYLAPSWQKKQLKLFVNYWSRQNWYSKIPFDEFHY